MKMMKYAIRIFALPILLTVKMVEMCAKATATAAHPVKRRKVAGKQ